MPIAHIFSPNGMPWESRIGQETFFSHFWLSQECSKEMHCHDARCESQANKNVRTHNSTTITIIIIKEVDGVTQPTVCGVCVKMVAELSCRYCNMLLCYVNALRMFLQCLHRHRFRCLSHKHTAPPHCSACTETRHNDEGRSKSVLSVCISLSLSFSLFMNFWFLHPSMRNANALLTRRWLMSDMFVLLLLFGLSGICCIQYTHKYDERQLSHVIPLMNYTGFTPNVIFKYIRVII